LKFFERTPIRRCIMKQLHQLTDNIINLLSSPIISTCVVVAIIVPSLLASMLLTTFLLSPAGLTPIF
jgi:ABC-type multidrug transport system permease subunit